MKKLIKTLTPEAKDQLALAIGFKWGISEKATKLFRALLDYEIGQKPNYGEIAKQSGASLRSVQEYLRELREKGVIFYEREPKIKAEIPA